MTQRSDATVAQLLAAARSNLDRVDAADLEAEVESGAVVVDIRPEENRRTEGEMVGAVVVDRNVLEWRLSPTSDHRLEWIDADVRVVLVCNEGYASSLAAATLQTVGLPRATDLAGGYRAWRDFADE